MSLLHAIALALTCAVALLWAYRGRRRRIAAAARRVPDDSYSQDDWRSRLADALCRVLYEDVPHEHAVKCLSGLSGRQLLALDSLLRAPRWACEREPREPRLLTEITLDHDSRAAYLFVAACDASGFVRERSLDAFRHHPGDLAIAAALIRCDDWVPQVRTAAATLLAELIVRSPTLLAEQLGLVVRLRGRQRIGEHAWNATIMPALNSAARQGRLGACVHARDWQTRKFALELIVAAEPHRQSEIARQAIRDRDVRVALWGLARLQSEPTQAIEPLLRDAAHHPAAAVRAAVMRLALTLEPDRARALVALGLADPSHAPRSAAAHVLEQRFAQSPRELWKAALAQPESRQRRAAMLGLCDRAEPEDVELLAAEAHHRSPRVRAAVLEGLWRARASDLAARLEHALSDPSRMVVRRALAIYPRSSESLTPQVLTRVLIAADDAKVPILVRGARQLDKWEALRVLLALAGSPQPARRAIATAGLGHWLMAANRRFTAPAAGIGRDLRQLMNAAVTSESDALWRELSDIIRRA